LYLLGASTANTAIPDNRGCREHRHPPGSLPKINRPPRGANPQPLGMRTISTEHPAWRATASETLPSRKCSKPLRPCDPTTIKSARHFEAASMILDFGSPRSTPVVTFRPLERNPSATFVTNVPACFVSASHTASRAGSYPPISRATSSDGGSTTCNTRISVSCGRACSITVCTAASENLEPSIASIIFMFLVLTSYFH